MTDYSKMKKAELVDLLELRSLDQAEQRRT